MPVKRKTESEQGTAEESCPARSQKGCATCERRRIRCDLRHPACYKCSKKGLECPGYNRQLRWVNGVAARGHLRGRALPTRSLDASQEASESAASPVATASAPMQREELPVVHGQLEGSPQVETVDFQSTPSHDLSTSSTRFMEYYRRNLAGLMVWLDSEENDYRRRVVPLAEYQPAIGFAIVAFAAQHGAMVYSSETMAAVAKDARDKSLKLVQRRAQEMTDKLVQGHELNNHSDIADAEWMLASILLINNYENARCCPEVAEGHRRAARTIVNLFSHSVSAEGRELFAFLRNQLAIEDVMAATTSFDPPLIKNAITPAPGSDSLLFSKYLAFLHQVTLTSMGLSAEGSSLPLEGHRLTMYMIQSEFEQARGATLMAAGRLDLGGSVMTRDFVRLVEVYHNAGLLYSFRCLECAVEDGAEWTTAATKLFDQLTGFEDQTAFIQNLPWPTFIAGTTCHGNEKRQRTVLALFTAIHQATRFDHYLDAVSFLQDFWAGNDRDWRPLARAREALGKRILVA